MLEVSIATSDGPDTLGLSGTVEVFVLVASLVAWGLGIAVIAAGAKVIDLLGSRRTPAGHPNDR